VIRELILRNRYTLIGAALLGLAVTLFEKQGAMDYAADRVWEEADAMTRRATAKAYGGEATEETKE
jgi:hypothetical protein